MTEHHLARTTRNPFSHTALLGMLLVSTLLASGCSSMVAKNPIDPLEPVNRGTYQFNTTVNDNVIEPAAEGYRYITPIEVRTAVGHFFDNLRDVNSTINYVLQAKPLPALTHFTRVLMNTTLGVVGLFDIAADAGLPGNPTGFGDTFAAWGWKKSFYVVLPFFGPSTVRDGSGTIIGISITNSVYPTTGAQLSASALNAVSVSERLLGLDDTIEQAAIDPYAYVRDGWLQMRAKELGEAPPVTQQSDEALNIDDLVSEEPAKPAAAVEAAPAPDKKAARTAPQKQHTAPKKAPAPTPAAPTREPGAAKPPITFSESDVESELKK